MSARTFTLEQAREALGAIGLSLHKQDQFESALLKLDAMAAENARLREELSAARFEEEAMRGAAKLAVDSHVALASQNARLVALLEDDAPWGSGCMAPFVWQGDDSKCINPTLCWEHQRRALLAEIKAGA